MPANKKHLSGFWTRFSKLMAAIPGAYATTMLAHMAIAKHVVNDTPIVLTTAYSSFLIWVGLMVVVYFIKNSWYMWGLLLLISAISVAFLFL